MRAVTLRRVLQSEFERRRSVNQRYSLRGFARSLGLDHATLSQILRGKRRLTGRSVHALGRRLHLPPADIAEYAELEHEAAVLAAVGRHGFRPSSRWLASATGLPVDAVNVTLQRLLRKRLLLMVSRDGWLRANGEEWRG
jgi:transcriptional regulator with XRE-family HTH domain